MDDTFGIPCADVLEPGSPGADPLEVVVLEKTEPDPFEAAVLEKTGPDEVGEVFTVGFVVAPVGRSDVTGLGAVCDSVGGVVGGEVIRNVAVGADVVG